VDHNKNKLQVLKCGAGEGRGRSVATILCKIKKYYIEPRWGGFCLVD
jgi:hypothetical protein